jgi:hypothetical protein
MGMSIKVHMVALHSRGGVVPATIPCHYPPQRGDLRSRRCQLGGQIRLCRRVTARGLKSLPPRYTRSTLAHASSHAAALAASHTAVRGSQLRTRRITARDLESLPPQYTRSALAHASSHATALAASHTTV